jgi:hypothetical protein
MELVSYNNITPMTAASRSKAGVFALTNAGVMESNATRGMNVCVCVCVFILFVLSCVWVEAL